MVASSSWTLPIKIILISVGVLAVAVTAKSSVSVMLSFTLNDLPVIWSVITSWMQPPYVYLVANGIIITIVVFTHFLPHHHFDSKFQVDYFESNTPPPLEPTPVTFATAVVGGSVDGEGDEDDFNATRSTWNIITPESVVEKMAPPEFKFPVKERPLVTSRFTYNLKLSKNNSEGPGPVTLRVMKPKKHETLDRTWKMITKSGRKSDMLVNLHRDPPLDESTKMVRKSETFKDRTVFGNRNHQAVTGKLKKELTPSHEELNRRIEVFIKKFNDNMRLQREESLNLLGDFQFNESPPKKKVTKKSRTFKDSTTFKNQNNERQSPETEEKLRKELTPSHEELNRRIETFIKKFNDDLRLQRQESLNQYIKDG